MGNRMAERKVLGQHLVQLALYRIVHPEGTIAEARAFLSNMDPTGAPFCPSEIARVEHILDLQEGGSGDHEGRQTGGRRQGELP